MDRLLDLAQSDPIVALAAAAALIAIWHLAQNGYSHVAKPLFRALKAALAARKKSK